MIQRLSQSEMDEVYYDILKLGLQGLKSLEIKQIEQVREYAESKHFKNLNLCGGLVETNANLPENYPPEYRGGRELEYWQSRLNGYEEPERVLDIISKHLNRNLSDMDKIPNDIKKRIEAANNIDVWMDWMANNFDTAIKDYPEMMDLLKETLTENPLLVSVKIEQTPENFAKWKNEIENCLESTKIKKINTYLELIKGLLYHWKFPNEYNRVSVEKIKPELLEMEAYFTNLLTKGTKQQKKTSYVWQNNPDKELPELHSLMIDKYKLIAPETTYEQFKDIFTGQPIESINPIKWIDSNRLLAYFLDSVFSGQDWQSIAGNGKLFKNKKGNLITANDLSVAKKGYSDFGKPKGYEKIDLLLKSIKKH